MVVKKGVGFGATRQADNAETLYAESRLGKRRRMGKIADAPEFPFFWYCWLGLDALPKHCR